MSKTSVYKKLRINYYTPEKILKNSNENHYNNKRRLLSRINYSNSKIEIEKIKISKDNIKEINKPNSNLSNINKQNDNIKQIKEEKEKKDIEKIHKKWNQEIILSKINNRYMTYKEENIKAGNDALNKIKYNIWEKALNEKIGNYDKESKKSEIFSKLNKNRMSKIKILEEMKNVDDEEIDSINQKAELILDKKNTNLVEKLEFILKIGKIIEKEVKSNKNNNLILPGKAIYSDDIIINFLGYFGSEISLNNIKTYIEEESTNIILRDITFNIILSGLASQKIYILSLDNSNYESKFRENISEWKVFLNNLKLKISCTYNISPSDMYFFEQKIQNNFEIKLLIYNQKLNNLENTLKNFSFKVKTSALLNYAILSPSVLEPKFSKKETDWPRNNLMRGGRKYYPPYEWIGIALKVKNKYGDDDTWLGKENKEGEWVVGYHGVGKGKEFNKILGIIYDNLKEGSGQMYDHFTNVENSKDEYPKCGEGVYLVPIVEEALKYADKTSLGWYKVQFQFVIMARVNPKKIRSPGGNPVIWILNGNDDEIRPYRLLIKMSYI